MTNEKLGEATFTPPKPNYFREPELNEENAPASVLESFYWQTLGWVHTPPFIKGDLFPTRKIYIPKSKEDFEVLHLYLKKAYDPKLQIEDQVPYGVLPKRVIIDIAKRRFSEKNFEELLQNFELDANVIRPPFLYYTDGIYSLKPDVEEGIPCEPFLSLDIFDDDYLYETRSPEEWLSLGVDETNMKHVPGTALVPVPQWEVGQPLYLKWGKVAVLDYDACRKMYLVRKESDLNDKNLVSESGKPSCLWVSRIYLKFDAEDPEKFAKRLWTAVTTRHLAEENLRLNYYIQCIPLEGIPKWPQGDVDIIISIARRSLQLQPKLQWIKDHLKTCIKEIETEYQMTVNRVIYTEISGQNSRLMNEFQNENISIQCPHKRGSIVHLHYIFSERFESFQKQTFLVKKEVVIALNHVEEQILVLNNTSLYVLPLDEILPLDKFESLQRTQLKKVQEYVQGEWMSNTAEAIIFNISGCNSASYDLGETEVHSLRLTKLGKLLRVVMFKMQDVIRFVINDSLGKYANMIAEACQVFQEIEERYVWKDDFSSNKWAPKNAPVFEVPLEVKDEQVQFVVGLRKYCDTVIDIFIEGLRVTQNLPRLEKLVMKKMLYNPDDKLETVGEKEQQIIQWRKKVKYGHHISKAKDMRHLKIQGSNKIPAYWPASVVN
ncbi:Dynein heavy chain 1, axonemal, partial [Stegodyphus mimosarum]